MSETLVFVYGTLLSGEANHHLLRGARLVKAARTAARYVLVDFGDHPGLVAGGATAVVGEVYAVDAATLVRLDAFEAEADYRREAVPLADGSCVDAWLITAARATGRPVIASGSWRGRRQG